MKVKPVALDAVAEVIAENIVGERPATSLDVAGPEIKTLWDMTEKVRRRGIVQVPLLPPGTTWRASRDGRLVPDPKVAEIGHTSPNGLQHEASDIQRTARKPDALRTLPHECWAPRPARMCGSRKTRPQGSRAQVPQTQQRVAFIKCRPTNYSGGSKSGTNCHNSKSSA